MLQYQALIRSIQTIDTDLSTKLEELKETIGTIDTSVNKWVDGSNLSQTEKAILASTDVQYGEERRMICWLVENVVVVK